MPRTAAHRVHQLAADSFARRATAVRYRAVGCVHRDRVFLVEGEPVDPELVTRAMLSVAFVTVVVWLVLVWPSIRLGSRVKIGGEPAFRCSGTMIEPDVLLTAGHCTNDFPDEPYSGMRVFYESDVDGGTANGTNNYPFAGPNSIEAVGWAAHPDYETAPFFVNDVGVVKLAADVPGIDSDEYGFLPEVDQLDVMKTRRGRQNTTFTAVGYGLQRINPVFVQADRVRMFANPHLIQINTPGFTGDFSLLLSNNHSTGGTCFGDSGGPNFLGDSQVVAGVTSFGLNGNCAGTGGVFRMDRQNVLDFVNGFIAAPP